jgi:hypothetical protein
LPALLCSGAVTCSSFPASRFNRENS